MQKKGFNCKRWIWQELMIDVSEEKISIFDLQLDLFSNWISFKPYFIPSPDHCQLSVINQFLMWKPMNVIFSIRVKYSGTPCSLQVVTSIVMTPPCNHLLLSNIKHIEMTSVKLINLEFNHLKLIFDVILWAPGRNNTDIFHHQFSLGDKILRLFSLNLSKQWHLSC